MRRRTFFLALSCTLLAGWLGSGCERQAENDGPEGKSPTSGAGATVESATPSGDVETPGATQTPREALDRFTRALREGDRDVILASIDQTDENGQLLAEMLSTTADIVKKNNEFVAAVGKKFGEDTAQRLLAATVGRDPASQLSGLEQQLSRARIDVHGDTASLRIEGVTSTEPLRLVRREGKWRLQPPTRQASAQQYQMARFLATLFSRFLDHGMKTIGEVESEEEFTERMKEYAQQMQTAAGSFGPGGSGAPAGDGSP